LYLGIINLKADEKTQIATFPFKVTNVFVANLLLSNDKKALVYLDNTDATGALFLKVSENLNERADLYKQIIGIISL